MDGQIEGTGERGNALIVVLTVRCEEHGLLLLLSVGFNKI